MTEYAQKVGSIVSPHVITSLKKNSRGTKPELLVSRLVVSYLLQIVKRKDTRSGGSLQQQHSRFIRLGLVYDCLKPTQTSFIQFMVNVYLTQTLTMVSRITLAQNCVLWCSKIQDIGTTYHVVCPVTTYVNGIKSYNKP